MKIQTGDTFEYCGRKYVACTVEIDSDGNISLHGHEIRPIGYTGSCYYHELGSSETKILGTVTNVKLEPRYIQYDTKWLEKEKQKAKFKIKKIQRNPKKNATTVIFENGHVEVVKRNELDPESDLYSVVAYAVAKYVYGSNSAFKRQIRDCIFESLEVK